VPALISGFDYNILGGLACTDAALQVTHPPRDPRPTEGARAEMLGAADRGHALAGGRLGTCHRTMTPRPARILMPRRRIPAEGGWMAPRRPCAPKPNRVPTQAHSGHHATFTRRITSANRASSPTRWLRQNGWPPGRGRFGAPA